MATLSSVIQLVQSLSRSEKRNFAIYSGLQKGDKDYLKLFKIVSTSDAKGEGIGEAFHQACPGSDLNTTTHYLYQIVMKTLVSIHSQDFTDEKLLNGIQETRILFRKGLLHEGFALMNKLRKFATENEKMAYCLLLDKLELHYYTRHHYINLNEDDLIKIQSRLRRNLQYELNLADHSALYELLNFRYLLNGTARDQTDKDKLNDLVFMEMNLAGNPRYQSFDLKKNHLLFQSVYFMMTGDNKSSLSTYFELNKLFEEHRYLWNDTPVYYIHHVRGILNNLHLTKQFDSMDFFIERLKELETSNPSVLLEQTIYIAILKKYLGLQKFSEAAGCIPGYLNFPEKINQLPPVDKAEVSLYTAITYLYLKEYKKAAKVLQPTVHLGNLPNKQLLRMIRLINLVIHFELHDFGYLNSEIRSLERNLKHTAGKYQTEGIVLNMMKKYPYALSRSSRKTLFESTLTDLNEAGEEPYEMQLFCIFDFKEWIGRKI